MRISNPSYNRRFNYSSIGTKEYEFITSVNLGDTVIYSYYSAIYEGKVKAITMRGVNVSTQYGDTFIKWYHVKDIIKRE